ncbi:hypothetical protein PS624_04700 [Pseudomonas fluorescens]|uniref:Uncharacterized protein n=1 Tax=Pseudomonas fluorescens TaxID=294 RepID=A0A5E6WIE5_PSEFL|nr:hypothetical protein PS624_04700 [Pseudomonas fluorescens]
MPLGHQFFRILITQFTQIEGAAPGQIHRFVEQGLRIQLTQYFDTAQMPLAIGV